MSEWAHDHPEEMEEIAKLPLSQQNEALRGAMVDPLEVADQQRKEARENPPVDPLFVRLGEVVSAEMERTGGDPEKADPERMAREVLEPSEPFEEVPGVICGRCDGKGWTMKDKNVKECVACLGTGLER